MRGKLAISLAISTVPQGARPVAGMIWDRNAARQHSLAAPGMGADAAAARRRKTVGGRDQPGRFRWWLVTDSTRKPLRPPRRRTTVAVSSTATFWPRRPTS